MAQEQMREDPDVTESIEREKGHDYQKKEDPEETKQIEEEKVKSKKKTK